MLIVVSPAKNLDYSSALATEKFSQPALLSQATLLAKTCKKLAPSDLSSLMGISDKLAILNAERFADFAPPFSTDNARQAVLAFNGDVYTGLDAASFGEADFEFAQSHLRILSGLYGVLRPLDLMQAYRLEMGIKLKTDMGNTLYEFWADHITDSLNNTLKEQKSEVLINLASNEYFKSVNTNKLNASVITPVFKDEKNGKHKIISFYAKKARGLMSRYIIQHKLTKVEQLKAFDVSGYKYCSAQSDGSSMVFKRAEQV